MDALSSDLNAASSCAYSGAVKVETAMVGPGMSFLAPRGKHATAERHQHMGQAHTNEIHEQSCLVQRHWAEMGKGAPAMYVPTHHSSIHPAHLQRLGGGPMGQATQPRQPTELAPAGQCALN